MKRLALLLASLALAGCPSPKIDLTEYSQSCETPQDCLPVYEGPLCGGCECPNAVINMSEQARYEAERAALEEGCQSAMNCDCVSFTPGCANGTCAVPK